MNKCGEFRIILITTLSLLLTACNPLVTQSSIDEAFLKPAAAITPPVPPVTTITQPLSQIFTLTTQKSQGAPITPIDFNNARTGDDTDMTYTCVFDRVVDGAVASGLACTALPGTPAFSSTTGILTWTTHSGAYGPYEIKVTGTDSYGSDSKTVVIDVRHSHATASLLGYWDAQFARSNGGQGVNSSLSLVDLTSGGVNATFNNFAGTTASGFDGTQTNATTAEKNSPYKLVFDGTDDSVSLGTSFNAQTAFYFDTWVNPSTATTAGKTIISNVDAAGKGFKLSQSQAANGKIALTIGGKSYEDEIMSDSPVGYWRLGEPANIATTSAVNIGSCGGTAANCNLLYGNSPTLGTVHQGSGGWNDADTSANFGGTSYANVATSPAPLDVVTAVTLEMWVLYNAAVDQYFIFKGNDSYDFLTYAADAGKLTFYLAGTSTPALKTPGALNNGAWHHVVATYDSTVGGTNEYLYVDGVQVASLANTGTISLAVGPFQLRTNAANGYMDEVAVYNTALSATRVAAHYAARSRPTCYSRSYLANGLWYEVAGSFTGGNTLQLYVNGAQECSITAAATYNGSTAALTLGADPAGTNAFSGAIADFKLYSTGNATTSSTNYNASKQRFKSTPEVLIASLKAWLSADAITSLVDGNNVTSWTDQSGNSSTFTQGNATYQPKYYSTAGPNSTPVVRFDGSDDSMNTTNSFTTTFGMLGNPAYSMFVVAKTTANRGLVSFYQSTGGWWNNNWDDNSTSNNAGGVVTGAFKIMSIVKNPGNYYPNLALFYNGISAPIANNGGNARYQTFVNSEVHLGMWWQPNDSAYAFAGDISEVLIFNTALSASDTKQIHDYLSRKYAIPVP